MMNAIVGDGSAGSYPLVHFSFTAPVNKYNTVLGFIISQLARKRELA
jgi:hypothetical protein